MDLWFNIRIDERTYRVRVGDLSKSPVEVEVDGQSVQVELEGQAPTQAAPPVRPPPPITPPSTEKIPVDVPSPAASTANSVLAPMPAKVISVAVKPGDYVSQGDTLCVLEAMKMEQIVKASRDGVVAKVNVQSGDNIPGGGVLIELES